MKYARIWIEVRKMARLSVPIIIAQLGIVLMAVADTAMIGHYLGKTALGAAGVAHSSAYLIASIAIGGLAVISPLIAKAHIEDDQEELSALYRASLWVATVFAAVLTTASLLLSNYFYVLQQPESVNDIAPPFLVIIGISYAATMYFLALKSITDGLSKPRIAMYITLVAVVINIILNYILIKGWLFIPALGLLGAAWATLITRVLMMVFLWVAIHYGSSFIKWSQRKVSSLMIRERYYFLMKLSIPSGLTLFFEVGAFSFTVVMMGWLGESAMAAHQISMNFVNCAYMISAGISYAGGIRVGEGRGFQSRSMIIRAGSVCFLLIALISILAMFAIVVFRSPLVMLYINDPEVYEVAMRLLFLVGIFAIFDGIQVGGLSVLRGMSDVNIPTAFTLFAYWILSLPLAYTLGFVFEMGAEGIYYGLYSGLAMAAVLVVGRFYWLMNKKVVKY